MSEIGWMKLFIDKTTRIGAGIIAYKLRLTIVEESADGTTLCESTDTELEFGDSVSLNQAWLAADRVRILYDDRIVESPLKEKK